MNHDYLAIIVVRLIVYFIGRTSYVPDEHFQFVEPALKAAFSTEAIETWEWLSDIRIRSYIPLIPLISCYKILKFLNIDYHIVIRNAPRAVQTILTIISDWCLYHSCCDLWNAQYAKIALLIHVFSWSGLYCLSRTLTNCMEMNVLIVVLYLLIHREKTVLSLSTRNLRGRFDWLPWPWVFKDILMKISCLWLAMILIAWSIFIRPTIVLLWIGTGIWFLKAHCWTLQEVLQSLLLGTTCVISCILVDSSYYNQWTVSVWNFFMVNVIHGQAMRCFGSHPWYWIFTEGIAVILGLYTPVWYYSVFFLYLQPLFGKATSNHSTNKKSVQIVKEFGIITIFYLIGLVVFTRHQEHRFLLPILPFCHMMIAAIVYDSSISSSAAVTATKNAIPSHSQTNKRLKRLMYIIMTIQAIVASYLLVFHQGGAEIAYDYIVKDLIAQSQLNNVSSDRMRTYITILAPCYTFPGYARITGRDIPGKIHLIASTCSYPWSHGDAGFRHFDSSIYNNSKELLALSYTGEKNDHNLQQCIDCSRIVRYVLTFDSYVYTNHTNRSDLLTLLQENYSYRLIQSLPHAHFRYDLDDPFPKFNVLIFREDLLLE